MANEPKWTPGPWRTRVNPMRDDMLFVCRDLPETPTGIRRLDGSEVMQPPPSVIGVGLPHADAYLIAAAPDLYRALNLLLHATMYKDHPAESDMAIAALKKARGEQ